MAEEREFDVVVLGAGPAGEVASGRLAEAGLKVAIVEQELVGGECSFYACMPSKALLRPGEVYGEARRTAGVREALTGDLDVEAIFERRDQVIHDLDDSGQLPWLESRGIELFRDRGRLDGERRVVVGDVVLIARRAIVLATGSSTNLPPIDGLRDAPYWTNREITTAKQVPERLAILGGGVVGVEMAQAWSDLGSKVTIVERGDRLLGREEPFAADLVRDALHMRGVHVLTNVAATAVRAGGGEVTIELDQGGPLRCDELVVAIGRKPNTEDVGLETVGLEPGAYVEVDDTLRVGDRDWLYAIGDVNGRALLTHSGKYQARIACDVILGKDARATADGAKSPRVIFTDPQVAAVGHTIASAISEGLNVRCVDVPTQGSAGASFYGGDALPGTTRLVVDLDRDVIVGATFCGFEVSEFLQAATVAVVGEVPIDRLQHVIPCFPTRSELWLHLLEGLE